MSKKKQQIPLVIAKDEVLRMVEGRAQALSIKLTLAVMELSKLDKKDIH